MSAKLAELPDSRLGSGVQRPGGQFNIFSALKGRAVLEGSWTG